MSFSASVDNGKFEYSGYSLRTMIAQKRNLMRPRFWNMVWDIMRFFREVAADADLPAYRRMALGTYLAANGYSEAFLRDYLLPLGSSIWSASLRDMSAYPLEAFVRFFKNHGLLEAKQKNRPQWRTVTGGSRSYVRKLTASFADRIRLNCAVRAVARFPTHVDITLSDGSVERFDHVVVATHSDQALAMLADPSAEERRLLGAIRYERRKSASITTGAIRISSSAISSRAACCRPSSASRCRWKRPSWFTTTRRYSAKAMRSPCANGATASSPPGVRLSPSASTNASGACGRCIWPTGKAAPAPARSTSASLN
jgi:predicted NAD/FAD-binding protein